MSETIKVASTNPNAETIEKYFSFQIKGWTNFDPMDKTLVKVAERIERGDGFLTLVEVLKVEDDVNSIDEEEAKECFENLLAAKRLIQKVNDLPEKVRQELRAVLKSEEEVPPPALPPPPASAPPRSAPRKALPLHGKSRFPGS
jgi:DNA-directed RNA polymerase subunit F